ncbi:MAG: two-component system response regulator NarL [Burkholderiales bacterium]|nr:MAG: two-component system response regulator NarL [Burkholderiales bacterium]
MEGRHTVLVVDDHPLFRKGVVQLLAMEPSIEVIGEAGNRVEALALVQRHEPDLTLLDLNLKAESGLDILAAIKADDPSRRVVMLTVSDAAEDLMGAIRAGADGYLLKDMEPEQLLDRVRASLAGETVIGPALAARLAGALRQEAQDSAGGAKRDLGLLTDREQQVLRCLADGQSNKRIARSLSITEGTVKVHVKNLLKKLSFRSRVEAAVWMAQQPH